MNAIENLCFFYTVVTFAHFQNGIFFNKGIDSVKWSGTACFSDNGEITGLNLIYQTNFMKLCENCKTNEKKKIFMR
jgi:hypothetical protein